jgi:hypothetical protein
VALPPKLELDFLNYSITQNMEKEMSIREQANKIYLASAWEALTVHAPQYFEMKMNELMANKITDKIDEERRQSVLNLYDNMGLNAEQIAQVLKYDLAFVKDVLEKHSKK